MKPLLAWLAVVVTAAAAVAPQAPERAATAVEFSEDDPETLKFAVIGDHGTGEPPQYDVARQMENARWRLPFQFVLMLGDNMYGRQTPRDFVDKFERPYAPLIESFVRFYAVLGNHDDPSNRSY